MSQLETTTRPAEDEAALEALTAEWRLLDQVARELADLRPDGSHPNPGALSAGQLRIVQLRGEAEAALRRIEKAPEACRRDAIFDAELAIGTLQHALWFVEHRCEIGQVPSVPSPVERPVAFAAQEARLSA